MRHNPLATLLALVRTIIFQIMFMGGSLILVPLALLLGLLGSGQSLFIGPKLWAGWFRLCSRAIIGIRIEMDGEIPQGPQLFALKHESALEAILTLWWFERPAVVMKQELRRIPIWGLASARHGSIFVDRSGSAGMLREMMRQAQAAVASGRPVVIFPEGTRVGVGETPPLAAGFAGLYKMLKLPVVAVALDSGAKWPKSFIKYPGTVHMKVDMVYLPCSPLAAHATLSEVYRVFVQGSPELASEVASRTAAAAAKLDAERAGKHRRILDAIAAHKDRATALAAARVRVTLNQLGMVRLRQGFLAAQPLVSEVVQRLMEQWYPDSSAERCEKELRSKSGPWDVFSVFTFLRRRRTFSKLAKSFGIESSDSKWQELEQMVEEWCF